MKANPLFILAGSVLWLGTLIGAYQLGHRQGAAQLAADPANSTAAGGNTRMVSNRRRNPHLRRQPDGKFNPPDGEYPPPGGP